ncbi:hypothetical protein HNQ71_003496 [Mesorhizobium sangaii]|uniref:Uncharacterized protein n=1 Tax=Mesorhizobium sangaii TaxID=505389 RepID=A0A841PKX1_9HYPH|nr:hypothetical protein [Mesorhizobium sangaii]
MTEQEQQSTKVVDGVAYIDWEIARKHKFAHNVVPPRPADAGVVLALAWWP